MKPRTVGVIAQAICTPIGTVGLAFLAFHLCAKGGAWLALPFVWLIGFFVVGLSGAHGLFYVLVLPLPESAGSRPTIVRALQAYWFLQVPFACFNGIQPMWSILATQFLLALLAIVFAITTRKGQTTEQRGEGHC